MSDDLSSPEPITEVEGELSESPGFAEASQPFVGRWNRLISTTNWEKGRIICQWREALEEQQAEPSEYSDESWSQRVGSVTGQHVGRLRRVYQRFGESYTKYEGLFWSHFQAAIEWDDAEMWLEGAVQNGWSISQMRKQRWETLGEVAGARPEVGTVVSTELDEDFETDDSARPEKREISAEYASVQGPAAEGPDFGDADDEVEAASSSAEDSDSGASVYAEDEGGEAIEFVRPFESLPDLPTDLLEAFDAFKLAILRHKTDSWQEVSSEAVLASLDALKTLVKAPSSEEAPF